MKLEIRTSINIEGTAKSIWEILTDSKNYQAWNPFIKSLKGNLIKGNHINIELPDMKFKPQILVAEEDKELRWLGKLGMKGIFDGEHYFIIEELADGTCNFIHGELFKGILVRPFKGKLLGETKQGFIAMNEALKERVENRK